MSTKVRGRIIRIVDTRTVIIDLGARDGLSEGCLISILGEPEQIVNPFTGMLLGSILVVKAKLRAEQVQEKFTIATKAPALGKSQTTSSFIRALAAVDAFGSASNVDELIVDRKDLQPWKMQSEVPVRVGDEVEAEVAAKDQDAANEITDGSCSDRPGDDLGA